MSVIVAVDGGGSRCRLVAYEATGQELIRLTIDQHASLSVGVKETWLHIEDGLKALRVALHRPTDWLPDQLVMGLAGSLQKERRQEFLSLLPTATSAILVTDGRAQLMGASAGEAGICLAIGTGSVLHWLDAQGSSGMLGGWGFPVGDEGSGAWIGARLLQIYLWHVDGRRQNSSLIEATKARVGDTVSAIQQWSTQSRAGVFAQLAPLVFEHAARGDQLAVSLLEEACDCALELVSLAPEHLPVYVVGGIGEQLSDLLAARLGTRHRMAQGDALQGLWQIAQQAKE